MRSEHSFLDVTVSTLIHCHISERHSLNMIGNSGMTARKTRKNLFRLQISFGSQTCMTGASGSPLVKKDLEVPEKSSEMGSLMTRLEATRNFWLRLKH